MINETIVETTKLTFEQVTAVTTHPIMIVAFVFIWLFLLALYLVIGAFTSGRSPDGKKLSKRMIQYPNFWILFAIMFFVLPALFLIIVIFPFWLKIF